VARPTKEVDDMPRVSPFPPTDLDDALRIATTIWANNAGKPMRRLTLFDALGRSPSSGPSRQLLTASESYGLTRGHFRAEHIELTERGRAIVSTGDPRARLDAVFDVPVFKAFFDEYRNLAVPSETAALDFLRQQGIREQSAPGCLAILLKCGEQVGLIRETSGAKRVVSYEAALERSEVSGPQPDSPAAAAQSEEAPGPMISGANASRPASSGVGLPMPSAVHIDIQIHIAADAKPEQINCIFASMAKHLYGRS
jgi:hypothetical protein